MSLNIVDFQFIRSLIHQGAGITLEDDKTYLAESRLATLARNERLSNSTELVSRLRETGSELLRHKVIEAMTTNETSFFRDLHPFLTLQKEIIPELIRRRAAAKTLTIWSAAASTGQEPYTLAMLLREHFLNTVNDWQVRIIATDLSTEVLARAQAGRFNQMEVNRGLPATYLLKYFNKLGQEWMVKEEVRKMIDFRPLNLIQDWQGIPTCDIIMIRNVMIYFDVATKKKIFARLKNHLKPDGYLFLGGAETTWNIDNTFHRHTSGQTIYYQLQPAQPGLASTPPPRTNLPNSSLS